MLFIARLSIKKKSYRTGAGENNRGSGWGATERSLATCVPKDCSSLAAALVILKDFSTENLIFILQP